MQGIYCKDNKNTHISLKNGNNVYVDGDLYYEDHDEIEAKVLNGHTGEVIGLLKLQNDEFLSISSDHTMILWNDKGRKQASLNNEQGILGFSEIGDDKLLTINEDETVTMWDLKKRRKLNVYTVKVNNFNNIELDQGFLFFITENNLDVYHENGKQFFTFKNQKNFFTDWKFLNGHCLTLEKHKRIVALWSGSGEKTVEIDKDLSSLSEILSINKEYFSLITKDNEVCIYDYDGKQYSSCKNRDLKDKTSAFIKDEDKLEDYREYKNNLMYFKHVNNPFHPEPYIPSSILKKYEINLENSDTKHLWNFFNRPLFQPILTLLKKEEKSVKQYKKQIHTMKQDDVQNLAETLTDIKKTRAIKKLFGIFNLILFFGFSASIVPILSKAVFVQDFMQNIIYAAASFGVLFIIIMTLWIKKGGALKVLLKKESELQSNIRTLDILMPKTDEWLDKVEAYRTSIVKQIPIIQDPSLYSGLKAKEIINQKIHGIIEEIALEECGITKDDILYVGVDGENNRESIVLNDWSLAQDKSNDPMAKKIIDHNEMSFWSTKEEGMFFAVQYIQYIFLTKDKIDVFNTYYDFLTDTFISKQARAYYYKDVTNIAKKEVERNFHTENGDSDYIATEITLQVSSGDSINLTIISPETVKNLRKKLAPSEDGVEHTSMMKELTLKREDIEGDTTLDPEEKQDQLEMIDGQINSLSNEEITINDDKKRSIADQTIQNIRTQIREHKTALSSQAFDSVILEESDGIL